LGKWKDTQTIRSFIIQIKRRYVMPEKINWTIKAQVADGPVILESQAVEVEAYGKIQVTIPNGETIEVEVQPGGTNMVSFLLVKSDRYNDLTNPSANLSLKVNDTGNADINLDAPLLLIGNGAVQTLDPGEAPKTMYFSNSLGTDADGNGLDANIEILVGRDSTPEVT
jgi:hypothetical protein